MVRGEEKRKEKKQKRGNSRRVEATIGLEKDVMTCEGRHPSKKLERVKSKANKEGKLNMTFLTDSMQKIFK